MNTLPVLICINNNQKTPVEAIKFRLRSWYTQHTIQKNIFLPKKNIFFLNFDFFMIGFLRFHFCYFCSFFGGILQLIACCFHTDSFKFFSLCFVCAEESHQISGFYAFSMLKTDLS